MSAKKTTQLLPLKPKATAVWLVDNTGLTFQQIAEFCGMHALEVQGIADGEVAVGIIGEDPVQAGQLKADDIKAAEADPKKSLTLSKNAHQYVNTKTQGARYTPVARRRDKPDAIAWLVKNYPEMSDTAIGKLIGSTKNTIQAIRTRSHWNMTNIKPRDPVLLGICSQVALNNAVTKAKLHLEPTNPTSDADDVATDNGDAI